MSDMAITKEQSEPFWARVRSALGAARPLAQDRAPAYGQAAMARSIGMKPKLGARIEEELAQGWHQAAARHVSMSLLVIEIDRFADYLTAYGPSEAEQCVLAVTRAITKALPRDHDSCLRLGPSGFVMVLPDLPALMARAAATNMAEAVRGMSLEHKESHLGVVTLSIGLAVTNPRGGYDRKFFEAAAEALKKAQRKGMGRLEGVDLRPTLDRRRKAA